MIATNAKKAFTLVELLVVISIIALLLSILMPSLQRAREQAKRILCLSNLKQLALAATNYTLDNDQYYPIAYYYDGPDLYQWDFSTVNGKTEPGILWQGESTIEKVHHCPSYKGPDNAGNITKYTGYNYNTSYIGHGQGENVTASYSGQVVANIVLSIKAIKILSTANCAIFGDGHYSAGANKYMRSPFRWAGCNSISTRQAGTQGFRHLLQTNVVWADGHANSQKTVYTDSESIGRRSVKDALDAFNAGSKNIKIGFLSPDNSAYDLK